MLKKIFFMLICLVSVFHFSLGEAKKQTPSIEESDFICKGLVLEEVTSPEELQNIFGETLIENERTVMGGRMVRFSTFKHGYTIGVDMKTGLIVDIVIKDEDFVGRNDVRYGATSKKILKTYGKTKRQQMGDATCYIYRLNGKKLILKIDDVNKSLVAWRMTCLPIDFDEMPIDMSALK